GDHRWPRPDFGGDRGHRRPEGRSGAGSRRDLMLDLLLHSDKKLLQLVATYGAWVYAILFAIVFAETGFVVTPFLPGDSLLFAAGALGATGALSTPAVLVLLALAAFTGNAVNYSIGRAVRPRVFGVGGGPM